ncbi:MAG: hypothetical protein AB1327_09095 [Bacillota bacterium]
MEIVLEITMVWKLLNLLAMGVYVALYTWVLRTRFDYLDRYGPGRRKPINRW